MKWMCKVHVGANSPDLRLAQCRGQRSGRGVRYPVDAHLDGAVLKDGLGEFQGDLDGRRQIGWLDIAIERWKCGIEVRTLVAHDHIHDRHIIPYQTAETAIVGYADHRQV